jgi:hypothetical protein
MPAELDVAPFQIDHVRARKHRGATSILNLAWTCFPCNNHKSCNAAGYDPESDEMQPLFNPREHVWHEHFEWNGPRLRGKTPVGRATIEVLAINAVDRLAFRRELMKEGRFPPNG